MDVTTSDKKKLPTWLGYTIVAVRFTVIAVTTIAVLAAGNRWFNIPPEVIPTTLELTATVTYFVIVAVTTAVVVGVMIWPAIAISWGVAWLLSAEIRNDLRTFRAENTRENDE